MSLILDTLVIDLECHFFKAETKHSYLSFGQRSLLCSINQGPGVEVGVGVALAEAPFGRTFFFFFLRATTAGFAP